LSRVGRCDDGHTGTLDIAVECVHACVGQFDSPVDIGIAPSGRVDAGFKLDKLTKESTASIQRDRVHMRWMED